MRKDGQASQGVSNLTRQPRENSSPHARARVSQSVVNGKIKLPRKFQSLQNPCPPKRLINRKGRLGKCSTLLRLEHSAPLEVILSYRGRLSLMASVFGSTLLPLPFIHRSPYPLLATFPFGA